VPVYHNILVLLDKGIPFMRMIKVHIWGKNGTEIKEVSLEEARKMIKEVYADPMGGFVVDRETGQVITEINPDIKELAIIDQMIGGG